MLNKVVEIGNKLLFTFINAFVPFLLLLLNYLLILQQQNSSSYIEGDFEYNCGCVYINNYYM